MKNHSAKTNLSKLFLKQAFIIANAFMFNIEAKACTTLVIAQQPSCSGGTGSATANSTGGTAPYTYGWSNGKITSIVTGLTTGSYTVTVVDAVGCSSTNSVSIISPAPIAINTTTTHTSCGLNNGTASANASGGTGMKTYSWSNGASNQNITGLAAGVYIIAVTDANGCLGAASISVTTISPPVISLAGTNVSCFGGSNGSAVAIVTNGTPPYTYNWSNGSLSSTANSLAIGNYTITITDANSCQNLSTATITEPQPITVYVSVIGTTCGQSNGVATVAASGGVGSFIYSWSNNTTAQSTSNLAAGVYQVTVKDANNCTATKAAIINCTTGVSEINSDSNFSIYPYPASGAITIKTVTSKPYTIQLINLFGQTIYSSEQFINRIEIIDVSTFSKGIYIIQLKDVQNNIYGSKKLIIQ